MPRLDPAVAAVRLAVRRGLPAVPAARAPAAQPPVVLVACSGGADSTALLAATVFELRRAPVRVVAAVVDHGLQDGSAPHTAAVVDRLSRVGADEATSARVRVDTVRRGLEAGAREARYAALGALARRFDAGVVLLGHTRDDQAETVLLGLAQGSGGRALSGMRPGFDVAGARFARPLLEVTGEQTRQACAAEGLEVWEDPHNADPRFVRARVRHGALPALERELGPGVGAALARTGTMLGEDLDALDELAAAEHDRRDFALGVDAGALDALPAAIRTRVLRLAALRAGCPVRDLTREHVEQLAGLLRDRPGVARSRDLPGPVRAVVEGGELRLERAPPGPAAGRTDAGAEGSTA